jgi:hypothetical protein
MPTKKETMYKLLVRQSPGVSCVVLLVGHRETKGSYLSSYMLLPSPEIIDDSV